MSILGELKRRKMFQVAAVYLVVAWMIMQVVDVINEPLNLPDSFDTAVIVFLAIAFPIALVLSWAFNVTPGGLVRDEGHEHSENGSSRKIEFVLIGLVGVAVLWLIYRTEFDSQPPPEPVAVEETAPDVLPNSVAVLPFSNLSPDPDNAFFAAGIHDTILNELAKISELNVIARTTMQRYADTEKSIQQIAEELRVQSVMEGSIQVAGGQVRVIAQLIEPQSESHLWSDTYDEDFNDIFKIQTDIATEIAAALHAELSPAQEAQVGQQMTISPEAYALYLKAMEMTNWDIAPSTSTPEFHQLLEQAIELDPNFARAYATKAFAHAYHKVEQQLAIELADRAVALDPDLGLSYAAIAMVHQINVRFEEALSSFETAYGLSPNDRDIIDNLIRFRASAADNAGAIQLARKLKEIDPGNTLLGVMIWASGDIDGALTVYRQDASLFPEVGLLHMSIATLERLLGNEEASQRAVRVARSLLIPETMGNNALGRTAHQYRLMGHHQDAEKLSNLFLARASDSLELTIGRVTRLTGYIGAADYDAALEQVEVYANERDQGILPNPNNIRTVITNMYGDPRLDTPEFVEARQELGYDIESNEWCIFPSCENVSN